MIQDRPGGLRWPVCYDEEETVRKILDGMSIARFGDGEFKIALGEGTATHKPDASLAKELRRILIDPPEKLLPAIPPMNPRDLHYEGWSRHAKRFMTILDIGRVYGSAMIGRPKSCPWLLDKAYLDLFRSVWAGRKVVGVCPQGHPLERLLRPTAASVSIVECPPVEAYSAIGEIKAGCLKSGADLAVICAGPAAKVLAYQLAKKGMQAVDLGRGSGVLLKHASR